jgi:hypothetical protein
LISKPLIIRLFAWFLILDPIIRIAVMAIEKDFPFLSVFYKAKGLDLKDFFNFWFLFPLSGALLLSIKSYSYILFIGLQVYGLYFHVSYQAYSWPYLASGPTISAILLQTINLIFVFYILLPRTRVTFFDKNLRWWERGSRFSVDKKAMISINGQKKSGMVVDLSYSGAMVTVDYPLKADDQIVLDFEILNKNLVINAVVVRVIDQVNNKFGIEFNFVNILQKFSLKFILLTIEKSKSYSKYRQ